MTRDKIAIAEIVQTMVESALAKGQFLTAEEIDAAPLAEFLRRFDWVIAIWPDGEKTGALIVRDACSSGEWTRCNSIPCDCEATALKFFRVCRGPDNHAPEPLPSRAQH
jgi:hypothetical protein